MSKANEQMIHPDNFTEDLDIFTTHFNVANVQVLVVSLADSCGISSIWTGWLCICYCLFYKYK